MGKDYVTTKGEPLQPNKVYRLGLDKRVYLTNEKGIPVDREGNSPSERTSFILISNPLSYIKNLEGGIANMQADINFLTGTLEQKSTSFLNPKLQQKIRDSVKKAQQQQKRNLSPINPHQIIG